jgi:uncharacterized membrane protein
MAILFPTALLILTPIFDIVRAITDNVAWSHVAFWSAFVGGTAALVMLMPLVLDWLALEPFGSEGRKKRARIPSLLMHAGGVIAFVVGVVLRLHAGGGLSPAAFALADVGITLLAVAILFAEPRHDRGVRIPFTPSASRM